ncbi:MAG TPA: cyclopropane fatty acyl phospholipid synthase [Candidatus Paceibacterota bacterium]|nr:cyclopropane fatty acyl phospholipid synthase [Candidatus Paceibacterota bacterium]
MKDEKGIITELAAQAGVKINGTDPWDIQVRNEEFYARVFNNPYLGLGESYMDGWWDCERLDEFFFRVLRADLDDRLKNWKMAAHYVKAAIFNHQTKSRSKQVAEKHYDVGNELYTHMLGRTMAYTCSYWKDPSYDLDQAQEAKFELICKKIGLEPGMKMLDLGCGFGSFLKYAAEHHGISGVGYNISKEQIKFAREAAQGLPVEYKLMDYRDATGTFDRVVSVGLAEHIGYKNYKTFLGVAKERLADDGIFLLHTIGSNKSTTIADPWTNKYIFPNGNLPSIEQFGDALEGTFVLEDWHNFGAYYDPTLMAWHENFVASWPLIKKDYDDRFYRMWNYYLLSCAGSFRARKIQLWQLVLSKKGVVGGYRSVR